ncbi:major facilitator superfamily transporter [Lasiosphaeria miniovina]|uniref:Major facilitator superfamily transporter n=1 Tax=Lasiosphaeria miniovina TaxID=1954250 RepID=A0AA40AL55_9PEZI|nr:major facilitator superfamily transporter [Lasiosphaeria miniovina]KAK0717839.1 major facilitator superfamily transporter [Lasiosphaeria miniovina]
MHREARRLQSTETLFQGELASAAVDRTGERKADRRLVRRLDRRLLPWLFVMYMLAFLDRTNIGNAKIANLSNDLPMTDMQYTLTLMGFFVTYALFEPFANVLLKKLRPSIFLPFTMLMSGVFMILMASVPVWHGLLAMRMFLGIAEAGLYPGINYYMSCWYKRDEFALRAAIFFSAASLSGAFGGFMAAAIQKLDGVGNLAGGRWVFLIEGFLTIFAAVLGFWLVPDLPHDARFLSPDDRVRLMRRLRADDQGSASTRGEQMNKALAKAAICDWKTWLAMLVYMGNGVSLYSLALSLPTMIKNMECVDSKSISTIQMMTVPPYLVGAVVTVAIGYLSDRYKKRSIFNLALAPIAMVGFLMCLCSSLGPVQYGGFILAVSGTYASVPITIAWVANNVEGLYKRAVVMGIVIGWGNLHGMMASALWHDSPGFVMSYIVVVVYVSVCMLIGTILFNWYLRRENAMRRDGKRDHLVIGRSPDEITSLGDKRPDFLYTT